MRLANRSRLVALVAGVVLVAVILITVLMLLRNWPAVAVLAVVVVGSAVIARLLGKRVRRGTVLELDLEGGVVETHGTDPLSRAMTRDSAVARDVVDALDRAADDDRITAVVVRLGNGRIELAHAQELRDAVGRFRRSGKRALAFAESFGESGSGTANYYLASAFSEIHLMPTGELSVTGLLAKGRFIAGLLDKLGVQADFDHRKEFKSALYALTETGFNEPHRQSITSLVGDQFDQVVSGIAGSRDLDRTTVQELIDTAPHLGPGLLEDGLVDHRSYRDDVYRAAGGNARLFASSYLKKAGRRHRKGKVIALIHGVGGISRGSSRFDPLSGGPGLGADDVASAFREAVDDDKVKAIVFRVDSPGGSAVGSEVVRHEVDRSIKAGKPVVVSMGNVAGSGGYWVSAGASHIVAQPATITGSIGVVSGKLVTGQAWAKAGVTSDEIEFGRMAGFGSSSEPFTEAGREKLETQLDTIYDEFIALVAAGRDLSREQVAEVAKGRVWTGSQAKELGLVDSLGGLDRAIDEARKAAGIDGDCKVTVYPKRRRLPFLDRRENSDPSLAAVSEIVATLRSTRQQMVESPQTRMPGF